jgi:WD40 repeat protein
MAHLLRGKQAGIQNDLSAGLNNDLFVLDDLARFGVSSQISCLAYDPVQSLLAVGTKNSQFGQGQIYVFGRGRIQAVFTVASRGASITTIQFCAERLIVVDSKNDVSFYSLERKVRVASHSPPGAVSSICSDVMLDYALIGLQSGDILAYDLDREALAPFRIPNLWMEMEPRARVASVVALQFHPRDIGTLLIGYTHGAVIYSFKLNKALRFFRYEVPRGAPGGDGDPSAVNVIRRPKLTQAIWHPTGTFVMTGYDDGSIVFWDTIKDGRMLMARTLDSVNIATPGAGSTELGRSSQPMAVKLPLFKVSWCVNQQDVEDTALLIAGGLSSQAPTRGLTLFELGRTPIYATSSWEILAAYFQSPKRQRLLPTPPGAEVVDYCLIPRSSPHFAGAHDPIAIIALLASGELLTLSFPSGHPITPTNQLHPSLSCVHPFVKIINSTQVAREKWLGLQERRQQGPQILQGGCEAPHPMRRYEARSIVQTVHADGTIRLWDMGYGDEIENDKVLQVDVGRAVGHLDNLDITAVSFAGSSVEMAVGLRSGEFVIFRWSVSRNPNHESSLKQPNQVGKLTSIIDRAEPSLLEGLAPFTLFDAQNGPVTAVCMSEVGFAAAGFQGGSIILVDLRGPAVILNSSVQEFSKAHRSSGLLGRSNSAADSNQAEYATKMEFSIMMLEHEDYSSILLHVGTNLGRLATFKIIPDPSGRYTTQLAGQSSLSDSRVLYIAPLNADTGKLASANPGAMGSLSAGLRVNGALLVVSSTSINLFRPASSRGAHRSFDGVFCDCASVVQYQVDNRGSALLTLCGDGSARVFALPSLRELKNIPLSPAPSNPTSMPSIDPRRLPSASITTTGNILAFTGPSEIVLLSLWGTGAPLPPTTKDSLFNPAAVIPARPTISNIQWVTGTQYITPLDMDILIGGPDRPPSKRMIAQSRADEEERRKAGRASAAGAASSSAAGADEGYWAYMQRQLAERTEKLGLVGDSMESLERNSSNWLDDVNKFVSKSKRGAATGCECSPIFICPRLASFEAYLVTREVVAVRIC